MGHLFLRTSQNYGGTCQVCDLPVPRTDICQVCDLPVSRTDTCQVCDLPVSRTDTCGCVDPRTSENFSSFVVPLECCIQQVLATLVRGTIAAVLQTQSRENNGTASWCCACDGMVACTFRGHCVGCYCIWKSKYLTRISHWQMFKVAADQC